jgi:hypothetical protein
VTALAVASPAPAEDYVDRLLGMVDLPALIARGWDPGRRRLVPLPSDPLFGYARCPVRGRQNVTSHTATTLCMRCQHRYGRWRRDHPDGALEAFLSRRCALRTSSGCAARRGTSDQRPRMGYAQRYERHGRDRCP